MAHFLRSLLLIAVGVGFVVMSGCGDSAQNQQPIPDNLNKIARAYDQAAQQLKRGPKNRDELKPFLGEAAKDLDGLFQSPIDNQPYVILWEINPRAPSVMANAKPLVIGYEKEGKNGVRLVFTSMGVMQMNEEQFRAASFPPGHQP
jgi:hypothetical protein